MPAPRRALSSKVQPDPRGSLPPEGYSQRAPHNMAIKATHSQAQPTSPAWPRPCPLTILTIPTSLLSADRSGPTLIPPLCVGSLSITDPANPQTASVTQKFKVAQIWTSILALPLTGSASALWASQPHLRLDQQYAQGRGPAQCPARGPQSGRWVLLPCSCSTYIPHHST